VNAAWATPGAILLGCGLIALTVWMGAARIATAVGERPKNEVAPSATVTNAGVLAASRPPIPAVEAPGASTATPPAGSGSAPLERPIVTYDSFDRRFEGKLVNEAEKKCWGPAAARNVRDDIVYLYLDVATDGTVQKVEVEDSAPHGVDPELEKLRELHRCVGDIAKQVRFMPLPAPVRNARVAAHRHVQKR